MPRPSLGESLDYAIYFCTAELQDQGSGIDWCVHSTPVGRARCTVSCWVISSVK